VIGFFVTVTGAIVMLTPATVSLCHRLPVAATIVFAQRGIVDMIQDGGKASAPAVQRLPDDTQRRRPLPASPPLALREHHFSGLAITLAFQQKPCRPAIPMRAVCFFDTSDGLGYKNSYR